MCRINSERAKQPNFGKPSEMYVNGIVKTKERQGTLKMQKSSTLTCVMVVQQLQPKFWNNWNENPITQAQEGNVLPLLTDVV
ncbi:hypothetical protein [Leuconostoc mesenteroides]|uniref:hypothetical protein n=1 Tax=Leuconostoc mesenteroides TaxID=1245 RepID=UPI003B8F99F4